MPNKGREKRNNELNIDIDRVVGGEKSPLSYICIGRETVNVDRTINKGYKWFFSILASMLRI